MEPSLLEENLPIHLRKKLVSCLNSNNRWKTFIEKLSTHSNPVYLDEDRLQTMVTRGMSHADWILEELFDRCCSYDYFCTLLRQFDLLEVLALLVPSEPMVIDIQPGNEDGAVCVERGEQLRLTCEASGLPRPTYQWYHDNSPVPGQNNCVLSIGSFSEEHMGVYCCHVKQVIDGREVLQVSADVLVDLMAVRPALLTDLARETVVLRGQPIVLTVVSEGNPPPQYEWYHSNTQCPDGSIDDSKPPNIVLRETGNTLEIKYAGPENEGQYRCRVYNVAGETFTTTCKLSVVELPPEYIASAKVALLIGNERYIENQLQGLHAPSNDIATLAEILTGLGFHVIGLHNLTRTEMYNAFKWFARILPEGSYALFYFAGHGFIKLNSKFMMPVDCPVPDRITLDDCWCDDQLQQILAKGKQLQLLVLLFDSCLMEFKDFTVGKTQFDYDLGTCTTVIGTATRNHQNAFESDQDANGLFVSHLKHHLSGDKPIVDVLWENMSNFQGEQQQPTVTASGSNKCSLTDPVKGNPEEEELLKAETEFPSFEQELYFSKTNERFTVIVAKHRNCFLNSIDLIFPINFTYNFSVEVSSLDVKLEMAKKDLHTVVTILNIQKVKTSLTVTVVINGLRQTESSFMKGPHDSYQFTFDCPLVKTGQLWHSAC